MLLKNNLVRFFLQVVQINKYPLIVTFIAESSANTGMSFYSEVGSFTVFEWIFSW